MPNANYRAGARLERLWIAQKRAQGYKVMRSAGSHGLIDCMAWNGNEIIMAQIKNGKAAYNDNDIADLMEMPRPPPPVRPRPAGCPQCYDSYGLGRNRVLKRKEPT